MIVIGSTALKFWFPDFKREPKDKDILVNVKDKWTSTEKVEYLENEALYNYLDQDYEYLPPDLLYTLKMSHAVGWDINWEKHVFDIQFLREKGCKLDRKLFDILYKHWNTVHEPNRRSDLEMSAKDFFDNAVECEFDHDTLHTILNPIPTYTKVLKEGAEVEVSEEKFNSLDFEDKCNLVYEEVELMSFERWPKIDYRRAYSIMLKKFIINHAPLWEAIFILENYILLHRPRRNHFLILNDGIKTIKRDIRELAVS